MIAVVDDEDSVRRARGRLLRSTGLDVEVFASGAAFLDSLRERVPSCVVLDLHMPGVDGWAVRDRLAAEHPGVPVVIITGRDTPESRRRAEGASVAAYLRKPVDGAVLLDAIRACTEQNGSWRNEP